MQLPSFFKKPLFLDKILPHHEEAKEYFLALEVRDKEVKAAVWQKEKERVALINIGRASYSGEWEAAIKAADEAIVGASGNVAQEQIEKVIFGISQLWTGENKILAPHLGNLKKLCTQLSLKPLGFVVIPEAVVNYLKQIEGIPPTALLVGIEETVFTLTLVRAGRIEVIKVVEGNESKTFPEQIEETLESFSAEILPTRVLLYNGGKDLEKIKGDFLSYRFSEKLPFLHLPKIEILDKDFDIKALVMTSGVQMGGAISTEEFVVEKEPAKVEEAVLEVPPEENRGFVKDKDILEGQQVREEELGLQEGVIEEAGVQKDQVEKEEGQAEESKKIFKLPSLPSFKLPHPRLPQIDFSFLGEIKWFLVFFILIVAVLGGGFLAAYWYLPKAEVKIWVQAKPLEKEVEITVSPNLKPEEQSSERAVGRVIEIEKEAVGKMATTGKKIVGDPAKGKITIYNKTENEKKFPAGTVVIGSNELRFTLDNEVSVASTAAFSTSFSSAEVQVTAVKIGAEGNLSSGVNFSFKDYPTSSYFAKSDGDFSGGTSREIPVVSKKDQEKLTTDLSSELSGKAKEELQGKLNSGEKLIEGSLTSSIKSKKFDKEVDIEASELNLTLSMAFKATAYSESDLKERLFQKMQEATPQGYELNREEIKTEVLQAEVKGEEATVKIAGRANLLPKLDLEEIRKNILGRKQSLAEDYIKNLGSVTQVEIINHFPLPFRLEILPRIPQNIKIEIISS